MDYYEIEKRLSIIESTVQKEVRKTKNATTLRFYENDDTGENGDRLTFRFSTFTGNAISFALYYKSKVDSATDDLYVEFNGLDTLTHKSVIGENRVGFGGNAVDDECFLTVKFSSKSNISDVRLEVSGIVKKANFLNKIEGGRFDGKDYVFFLDGGKKKAVLYKAEGKILMKKYTFDNAKGCALVSGDERGLILAVATGEGVDFYLYTPAPVTAVKFFTLARFPENVTGGSKFFAVEKGRAYEYAVSGETVTVSDGGFYAGEISQTFLVADKYIYTDFGGVNYLVDGIKKRRLGTEKNYHPGTDGKAYCSSDGIIIETDCATGKKTPKAYADEYLPLFAGYAVRRGSTINYKLYEEV